MREETYITASEIGTYCFCKRAWHLGKIGIPSALTRSREAGSEWHEAHSHHVATAMKSQRMAHAFGLAFVVLILLLSLVWMFRL